MATTIAETPVPTTDDQTGQPTLYRIAALSAALMIALVMIDMGMSLMAPGSDNAPGSLTALDWFALFETDAFRAVRDLGIFNILNTVLGIPVFYALYLLHRHDQAALAGLSLMLFLFGGAIYIANNTVLPMLALSRQYAAATTDIQRASLMAAGEAMLARGADFTPGTLVGFVLPSLASILMAYVVLRGTVFSKVTARVGLVGFTCLLVFAVWVTLFPSAFNRAMLIAIPGGLGVLIWNGLLVRRFYELGVT